MRNRRVGQFLIVSIAWMLEFYRFYFTIQNYMFEANQNIVVRKEKKYKKWIFFFHHCSLWTNFVDSRIFFHFEQQKYAFNYEVVAFFPHHLILSLFLLITEHLNWCMVLDWIYARKWMQFHQFNHYENLR